MKVAVVLVLVLVLGPVLARADETHGKELYVLHCSSCHGLVLQGSPNAPPLVGRSAADVDFVLRTGRMPAQIATAQTMQRAPQFSHPDIRAIVEYVSQTAHGTTALPHVGAGDPVRGRELFAENCEQCHGASGEGDSVGYRQVAPSLMEADPQTLAEAIRVGPSVMPRFGTDVLSDRDVNDIVAFVGELRAHAQMDRGGLAIGNVGPVAEGFVGWVVGLGLLAFLMRRLGTTT